MGSELRTLDGLGAGSTLPQVTGVLGSPDETRQSYYQQGVDEFFYRFGDYGMAFSVENRAVLAMWVGDWVAIHAVEGCL